VSDNSTKQHRLQSFAATAALVVSGCLWGTGFLFGKIAFAEMTNPENVAFRFAFGSAALLPFLLRRWVRFTGRDLVLLLLASVVGVPLQFLVQFHGLELTTVSHASLMIGTLPVMLALSSVLFMKERLRAIEWAVLALSAAGVALISLSSHTDPGGPQPSAHGDLLVVGSLVASVVMILATKRLMEQYDPLHVTAAMLIMGTVILWVWVEATTPVRFHFSTRSWIAVAAQGLLATTFAYLLWNWGLARVPTSRAGVFLNMEPLVGAILGVAVLGERLNGLALLGGALIIGSAAYFSVRKH
jgi:drug/metabolite transporter (DMT)-like permease